MLVGASIIGLTPITLGAEEVVVTGLQGASISGTVLVGGTVAATQSGTWSNTQAGTVKTSLVSTVPSSVIVGASIFGLAPVNVTNTTLAVTQSGLRHTSVVSATPSSMLVGASVFGNVGISGTAAVTQSTTPWAVTNVGSVIAVQKSSVISVTKGSVAATIINVPQASVHGTVSLFPASALSGHGSVNGAASVQVFATPGAGLFNYVTDFLLSNTGAATTLVTFTDGDGSIMGKSIAPTGGGAIATSLSTPMKAGKVNGVVNIAAATATSVLHAWVGGYKAP